MRQKGRISPRKAATLLGVHYNTVITWCQRAVRGEASPLHDVSQHVNGYYWISLAEVTALRQAHASPT